MNTIRKSLTVLACAALLTGCASNTPTSTAASSSNSSDTLRVGMECNYAPFNWSTTKANTHSQSHLPTIVMDMTSLLLRT